MNFRSPLPKNPLIKNQTVISIRNLTTTRSILKYQLIIEPLVQSPIELNLVKTSSMCMDPST